MPATDIDNGLQQINIHSFQELTSLNANKLFLGLFKHGVYDATVTIEDASVNINFNILKGSTFLFEKTYEEQLLVSKITLQEDATLAISKAALLAFETDEGFPDDYTKALILYASWDYNLKDQSKKYIDFKILPYQTSNLDDIKDNEDLVVAVILNHDGYLDGDGDYSQYKVSYQNQQYRNVIKNTFDYMSNFEINFTHGTPDEDFKIIITVGKGHCILGDTYIHNKDTLSASYNSNPLLSIWPIPVDTGDSGLNQIDVLRLKTERNHDNDNTPYLQWESFLKPQGGSDIAEFIDGFDFVFEDIGYNLMFVVRNRDGLNSNSKIWPDQCLIVNPLIPQIGIPEKFSRFKLPVY